MRAPAEKFAGMDLRFNWQAEIRAQSLPHVPEGGLCFMPVRVVHHQAAEHEGMVLRVMTPGVAAFVDVEEMHAAIDRTWACESKQGIWLD